MSLTYRRSRRVSSQRRFSNPDNLLKLPNADDILDLTEQIRRTTHLLSSCLNDEKLTVSLASQHGKLVGQLRSFCDKATALFRKFQNLSAGFANLLKRMFDPDCHSSVKDFAGHLCSQIESLSGPILTAEQQYLSFAAHFRDFSLAIPANQHLQDVNKVHQVFQRLDGFWKVVATQLSSRLERRSKLLNSEASNYAVKEWEKYEGCLVAALDAIAECSDALKASVPRESKVLDPRTGNSLTGYVKKGFTTFWTKLIGLRSNGVHGGGEDGSGSEG